MSSLPLLWSLLFTAFAGPTVAVTPFDDAADSKRFAALGRGLQSMLTTDLSQVEAVTLVERARLKEVLDEQALGQKGVLDPATAAEVGRVVGASHLLTGSYTVVDGTMRLDARLVDAQSGEVVKAFEATGPRDEFFELEKQLVAAVLEGLGAELSARERVNTQRVHTLEFDLFLRFSDSLAARDRGAYEEARKALAEISASDEDFRLARATLEEIAALRDTVQSKKAAAQVVALEKRLLGRNEDARQDARDLARLWAVGDDPSAPLEDRVTALYLIAVSTTRRAGTQTTPVFTKLQFGSDAWALERVTDEAYQGLWALLRDHDRYVPLLREDLDGLRMPRGEAFDARFAAVRARLFSPEGLGFCTTNDVPNDYELDRLWLSERDTAIAQAELGRDRTADCGALYHAARNGLDDWIRVGDREAIAKWLADWARDTEHTSFLELIDSRLAVLEKLPEDPEWAPEGFGGRTLRQRVHVAGHPVWNVGGTGVVQTALPTGIAEGDALAYTGSEDDRRLMVVGGDALSDASLAVRLHALEGDATVGLLVGMTDVDAPPTCDRYTKGTTETHPTRAWAAMVSGGVVRLGQLTEVPEKVQCGRRDRALQAWTLEEVGQLPLKGGDIRLEHDHGTLRLTVGKKVLEHGLEGPIDGFTGLVFEGAGQVEVHDLVRQ